MNKKAVFAAIVLMSGLFFAFNPHKANSFSKFSRARVPDTTAAADEGIDVLKYVQAMNADNLPKPGKDFMAGHVSFSTTLATTTNTKNGFMIKLPSNTNVPTPTVHNGIVYVSGGFGSKQYFAFDAKTGEKKWAVDLDDDGPSSAVMDDNTIVYNTESCTIFACDIKTGGYLWSHWLGDPLMSMPVLANGKVFTAYPSALNYAYSQPVKKGKDVIREMKATHAVAAFDEKSGKVLWQKWIDGDIMSAPVAKDNYLYFTTFPGTVYKMDQSTGEFISARYMRATSAPVILGDDITVSRRIDDRQGAVYEDIADVSAKDFEVSKSYGKKQAEYLDKNVQNQSQLKSTSMQYDAGNGFGNGAPVNSGAYTAMENIGQSNVSSLQSFQGSRVLSYNGRHYNTMGDEIVCSDPADGKVMWKSKLDGDLHSAGGFMGTPPLSVGGSIIIATYTGQIKVMDAETGKVTEKYETGESIRYQPVVEDGWIYATTTSGKMIAINTSNTKLTGWPMWGGNAQHTNVVE